MEAEKFDDTTGKMALPPHYNGVLYYFHFWPSKDLAIIALTLFLFAALTTFGVTVWTRQWYMVIVSIVGLLEMGGYACRIAMFHKPEFGPFVAMQCLLIIPPSFLALAQYITLAKVVGLVKQRFPERRLLVKPTAVIWGFFVLELVALSCQGAGAGTSVNTNGVKNGNSGKVLLIVGLAALVLLIMSYLVTAIYVNRSPLYEVRQSPNLQRVFWALYTCTTLLLVRNIFRLIEFSQGFHGWLARHEVFFYVFDALLMFLLLMVNTFFHFGFYLNAYRREVKQVSAISTIEVP